MQRDTTFLCMVVLNIGIRMWTIFVIFLCTPEGATGKFIDFWYLTFNDL